MTLLKDTQELVNANIISLETANKIKEYYKSKGGNSTKRLFTIFSVLGAILIGLGIILFIAHNWDNLSKTIKTLIAFLPLIIGHLLCIFTLLKKSENTAWRESCSAFLFFAVGASISLISQIYHIPGNVSSFMLSWMLLCLPVIYLMKSSITGLLYIAGATYYACSAGYWSYPSANSYYYWLMLVLVLPYFLKLYKQKPNSNFISFYNWFFSLSLIISLGTLSKSHEEITFILYFNLFAILYLIGLMDFLKETKVLNNAYKILGALGTIIMLLMLSFDWFWDDLRNVDYQFKELIKSSEFLGAAISTIFASTLLFINNKNKLLKEIKPISIVFILFIITFAIGLQLMLSVILINIIIFSIGILTIIEGGRKDHLGILNFGLLIITALVTCRFFDEHLSFIIRGTLFVVVGIGFFATNFIMLKKRKIND